MEEVIAVFVGVILIWLSIKVVKAVFKLIFLVIAIVLILGAFSSYYDWSPFSTSDQPQKSTKQR
jgi:hypothetical protein